MVTVVLADDHAVVRQGLRALLESDPQVDVVGEAASGVEAVELAKRKKPRVLIVDLIMPGLDGLQTTRKVLRLKLGTRVIILSMYGNEAYVLEALRIGAAGYVAKESSGSVLLHAIREVALGRRYLSPSLYEASRSSYESQGTILRKTQTGRPNPYDTLTARERTVLALSMEGTTCRDIGIRLKMSPRAVESHRTNLMRKLGLKTYRSVLRDALRLGAVPGNTRESIREQIANQEHRGKTRMRKVSARVSRAGRR